MPLRTAATLVTALSKLVSFALIHWLFRRWLPQMRLWMVTVLAVVAAMVSSLCWPSYNPTVYLGAGTPNTWHSCTQMLVIAWMLVCVPYVAHLYDESVRLEPAMGAKTLLPWRKIGLMTLLLLCSLAAKPTFMQTFLPAACLFFLVKWIQRPRCSRYFCQVLVGVVPAVVLMILQYMFYFGIIVTSESSMVLEVSLDKIQQTAIMVGLMQAFPMYALLMTRKQPKDTVYWLTLTMNAVGIVEFLILGEGGPRAADGNFGWGLMGAALMLWVVALPRFAQMRWEDRQPTISRRVAYGAGWALLGWHLCSGVYYVWYLLSTGASL